MREHGTTRRRPIDVLAAEEREALLPLPARPLEDFDFHFNPEIPKAKIGRLWGVGELRSSAAS